MRGILEELAELGAILVLFALFCLAASVSP